jgi:DNA-binding response OmpR family regulator
MPNPMVTFDSLWQTVEVGSRKVCLTPTEFRLLVALAKASGRSVANFELGQLAFRPYKLPDELAPYIYRLRRKLGKEAVVRTEGGYRLGNCWDTKKEK